MARKMGKAKTVTVKAHKRSKGRKGRKKKM